MNYEERYNNAIESIKRIYDQAMQDFVEKACEYLAPINYTHPHLIDLDEFKKVLQNE